MSPFTTVSVDRWGGHNGDENPGALRIGELQEELNVYLRGETLGTRPGLEHDDQYTSDFDPGTTDAIQGIYEARTSFDATRNLLVIADGKLYVIGQGTAGATPTDVTGSLTITAGQDNRWHFASFKGDVFFAGGSTTTTGNTSLGKWTLEDESTAAGSLSNASAVTISGTSQRPLYLFSKWNRLWANGFQGTDPDDNPMAGRYSALNDGDTWPEANSIGGVSAVGGLSAFGGEFSTGWAEYEDNDGDWLLYLTNRRIYAISQTGQLFSPFAKTDNIDAGCVNQSAFVNLGTDSGDAIWVSDQGIHSIRQSQQFGGRVSKFLSWKIRDIWKTLNRNRLKHTVGAYWPNEGVVIFAMTTGSNTSHDLLLCLDVKANEGRELTADGARWYQWRLASGLSDNANVVVPARDASGTPYVYVGTTGGKVLRFDASLSSDVSSPYAARAVLADHDLGLPGVRKTIGRVFTKLQPGGSYQIQMRTRFNYGDRITQQIPLDMPVNASLVGTAQVGTDRVASSKSTLREVVRPYGSGETIGFDFSHSVGSEPFYLASLSYEADAGGVDVGLES